MRVLVVEDEQKVADALKEGLTAERYDVVVERTGDGGIRRGTTEPFDLVVLDLALPGTSGLDILAAIRRRSLRMPVIILTARDTVYDRVAGLDAGADDYLVKPFAFAELLARIRALARRGADTEPLPLSVGPLSLDQIRRQVTLDRESIALTVTEFEILRLLMQSEGQVVSRETIGRAVWPGMGRHYSLDNVIDVHIVRLRRKVDLQPSCRLIHTIRGVGFTMRVGAP